MYSMLAPEAMLKDALFDIEFWTKKIITRKIRADFTGEDYDKKEVQKGIKELQIAQHTYLVMCKTYGVTPEHTPNDSVISLLAQ